MKSLAVIGSQWGDEGKGKITDLLGERCDLVIRYQGGNNAGHTIIVGEQKIVLHLLPSGVLRDNCRGIIGHGLVVDPGALVEELEQVEKAGFPIPPQKLTISAHCSVVTRYHQLLDKVREKSAAVKIGTTQKGIGPSYEDKFSRRGIKLKDLTNKKLMEEKLQYSLSEKRVLFEELYNIPFPSPREEAERLSALGERIAPLVGDTFGEIERARERGETLLYEGAQGVLLDIDYGFYPFVTSSHTTLGGIFTGAMGGGRAFCPEQVIGVTKAYMTRVGSGPFPTELSDQAGDKLQSQGKEWGATTGRKRRCGWLDLPLLRYAVKAGGLTSLALTKLDVLSGINELKVCSAYQYADGTTVQQVFPGMDISAVRPIYRDFSPFHDTFEKEDFSPPLNAYLDAIEEAAGIPVSIVTYGPERKEVQFRRNLFPTKA